MKMKAISAPTRLIEVEGQLMHDKWGKERVPVVRGSAGMRSQALIEPETFARSLRDICYQRGNLELCRYQLDPPMFCWHVNLKRYICLPGNSSCLHRPCL